MNQSNHLSKFNTEGYAILSNFYSEYEVLRIGECISKKKLEGNATPKSKDLFAIRQLFIEVPELTDLIFNNKLKSLICRLQTEGDFFLSKAIFFDKPEGSNWFVAYHQDLTINVVDKIENEGFKNWTNKRGQIGVQPPMDFLERTITIRIHLDDTDESNGALSVIPRSHTLGVIRKEEQPKNMQDVICNVQRGGIMLMKPLTLHASSRSTGNRNRRVIHLEFCDKELPHSLKWKERLN